MIRVGTCGSISKRVGVGSVVIADSAVRMDGTSAQYVHQGFPAAADPGVVMALASAARGLGKKFAVGVAASTDSFYPGQGREGFGGYLPSDKVHLIEDMRAARVLCFEMEAATLFTVGRVLGVKTGAVLAVVGNRETDEFKSGAGLDYAIDTAIGAVPKLAEFRI